MGFWGCNVSFAIRGGLRNHNIQHHSEIWHECHICKKRFKFRNALNIHMRCVHLKVSRFFCDVCGKGFYLRYKLDKHKRQVHNKRRPFPCDICSKSFRSELELEYHKKLHDAQLQDVTLSGQSDTQVTIITDIVKSDDDKQQFAFVRDFNQPQHVTYVEDLKDVVADQHDDQVIRVVSGVHDMQYSDEPLVKLEPQPEIHIIPAPDPSQDVVQHILQTSPAAGSASGNSNVAGPRYIRLSIIRK